MRPYLFTRKAELTDSLRSVLPGSKQVTSDASTNHKRATKSCWKYINQSQDSNQKTLEKFELMAPKYEEDQPSVQIKKNDFLFKRYNSFVCFYECLKYNRTISTINHNVITVSAISNAPICRSFRNLFFAVFFSANHNKE